jgi:hypothetical protein
MRSKAWMPGTRFMLEPAGGRTRVPGMSRREALEYKHPFAMDGDERAGLLDILDQPERGSRHNQLAGSRRRARLLSVSNPVSWPPGPRCGHLGPESSAP